MPLYADGLRKIRRNLAEARSGLRPRAVKIGFFTAEQLAGINEARAERGFPALLPEIVFHGAHLYRSRCVRDGYTIDQVLEQIQSAFSDSSQVNFSASSSIMRNPDQRMDHNGNLVHDEAVFECTGRYPYADLFSVIPKGDGRPGLKKAKGPLEE
ncbi:MAG: hypothetical protein P4K93_09305 [Terracidiphilus sp.]|nr:hypothetical protein [Terracidiphilus sp.]MDR3798338.1 hypothetical protein [Terracidiphilus sp.]